MRRLHVLPIRRRCFAIIIVAFLLNAVVAFVSSVVGLGKVRDDLASLLGSSRVLHHKVVGPKQIDSH